MFEVDCSINKAKTKLCYNRADFDGMRQFLRKRLHNIDSINMSATTMWDQFNDVMQDAIKFFVYGLYSW